MPLFIYSSETVPNPAFFGKPGYTPEWFMWNGIQLPILKKGEWIKLPDNFYTLRHKDWKDKSGSREHVAGEEIAKALRLKWGELANANDRGVRVLDHEPTADEKKTIAIASEDANLAFRMNAVEWYEDQVREKEVTGRGRAKPTPYENECYEVLGLTKPYSVEALRAQRHPGEAVGEQIVNALERLNERRQTQAPVPPAAPAGKPQPAAAR